MQLEGQWVFDDCLMWTIIEIIVHHWRSPYGHWRLEDRVNGEITTEKARYEGKMTDFKLTEVVKCSLLTSGIHGTYQETWGYYSDLVVLMSILWVHIFVKLESPWKLKVFIPSYKNCV